MWHLGVIHILELAPEWLPLHPFYEIRIRQFIREAQCREKHAYEYPYG